MVNKKGQTMLEYSFLITIVVAALIAMFIYISFSIRGKYRDSADVFGQGEQYEPGVTVH